MKNVAVAFVVVLVGGSACGSSGGGGASQELCALASACSGGTGGSFIGFGELCEIIQAEATLGPSLGGAQATLFAKELSCLQGATDCKSFQACVTVPSSASGSCGSTSICTGGYAVQCGAPKLSGLTQGQDCAGAGLVCAADAEGAGCGTAACDAATTKPTCDGENLVTCAEPGGAVSSVDCKYNVSTSCTGTTGGESTCQTQVADTCAIVDGTATCVGSGAACDATTTKNSCDGTSIVSCTGGKLASFDCTSEDSNATCQIASDGSAECVGAGTECTTKTPETCVGGVVTYCLWGTTMTADCKSYGLSGCTTQTANGVQAAGCTP